MDKLVLIDGNSLLNRAFFATPLFTTKSGEPTNAIFGFIKLFLKILAEVKPQYAVVAFDMHGPTFRHQMYDGYKATRKGMPEELAVQLPVLKECLSIMQIKMCYVQGIEADDILGTLSRKFKDVESYIYTGDRDSYQLVKDNVRVCFTRKGVSDLLELTQENFHSQTGLTPEQIVDLKSLMGDSSDNIPGVPGVGEKTAHKLLEDYGDLDGVYAHIAEIKGSLRTKLENNKELAYLSHDLATIRTDVPIDLNLDECRVIRPFPAALKQKFASLEFRLLYADDSLYEKEQIQEQPTEGKVSTKQVLSYADFTVQKNCRLYSVVWEDARRCIFADGTEYVLAEGVDLLNRGVDEIDCEKIWTDIFSNPDNTVILYRIKEVLYRLQAKNIPVRAHLEDVSILRYLGDNSVKDEELDFLLTGYQLSPKTPACSLFTLYGQMLEKVRQNGMEKLYTEMERPLIFVLFDMENAGVCVDVSALNQFSEEFSNRLKILTERVRALAGEPELNINSSKQLSEVLFGKLGLSGGKKGKNGVYSSASDVLEKLAPEHEIVREILEYRKVQKLLSTYVDGLKPFIRNGKVHTTYTQVITSTGRLSSKNPNLQNIPIRTEEGKELRKVFKASEGNVLIDADYSQIELRLMAEISACQELIEAYTNGRDIHRDTASKVYGVPLNAVSDEMRRAAKAVNFGIIYGESAFGLSQSLGITPKQAGVFIEKYFQAYPAVKEYQTNTVAMAKEKGYAQTLFGRRREIPELKSPNFNVRSFGERAAMNMPLQGTSADVIKLAMLSVHRELKKRKMQSKLILQVHDELVIDAPQTEAEEAAAILKSCMENVVKLSVPLTVEVAMGKNWYEAK